MADNLTPEQRRYCMAQVKGKDTGIERRVRSELHRQGLRFRKHVDGLPGRPDIVFPKEMVAIFIDGDFWHGYEFSRWKHKLPDFWRQKIARTRLRDSENHRLLKANGWTVIRIWEHEVEETCGSVIRRILVSLGRTADEYPDTKLDN